MGKYLANININKNFLVISLPGSAPHVMLKITELIFSLSCSERKWHKKTIEHDILVLFLLLRRTASGPHSCKCAFLLHTLVLKLRNSRKDLDGKNGYILAWKNKIRRIMNRNEPTCLAVNFLEGLLVSIQAEVSRPMCGKSFEWF